MFPGMERTLGSILYRRKPSQAPAGKEAITALRSEAVVGTMVPDRYLAQLCRQFSNRGSATYTAREGRAEFGFGHCSLQTARHALMLVVEAKDETSLARVQHIVSSYLEQSMWREKPTIKWIRRSEGL